MTLSAVEAVELAVVAEFFLAAEPFWAAGRLSRCLILPLSAIYFTSKYHSDYPTQYYSVSLFRTVRKEKSRLFAKTKIIRSKKLFFLLLMFLARIGQKFLCVIRLAVQSFLFSSQKTGVEAHAVQNTQRLHTGLYLEFCINTK